jgi:hypothetical protein
MALYKDATSSWGPPMRVVPVSMAAKGLLLESVIALPLTVIPDKRFENYRLYIMFQTKYLLDILNSQKEGGDARFWNSMSPLKSVEFVPPRVKRPSGARDV